MERRKRLLRMVQQLCHVTTAAQAVLALHSLFVSLIPGAGISPSPVIINMISVMILA